MTRFLRLSELTWENKACSTKITEDKFYMTYSASLSVTFEVKLTSKVYKFMIMIIMQLTENKIMKPFSLTARLLIAHISQTYQNSKDIPLSSIPLFLLPDCRPWFDRMAKLESDKIYRKNKTF